MDSDSTKVLQKICWEYEVIIHNQSYSVTQPKELDSANYVNTGICKEVAYKKLLDYLSKLSNATKTRSFNIPVTFEEYTRFKELSEDGLDISSFIYSLCKNTEYGFGLYLPLVTINSEHTLKLRLQYGSTLNCVNMNQDTSNFFYRVHNLTKKYGIKCECVKDVISFIETYTKVKLDAYVVGYKHEFRPEIAGLYDTLSEAVFVKKEDLGRLIVSCELGV